MNDMEKAALALVHTGSVTVSEAADAFGIPQPTLYRWCRQAGFDPKVQRANFIRRRISIASFRKWKLPRSMTRHIKTKTRGVKLKRPLTDPPSFDP